MSETTNLRTVTVVGRIGQDPERTDNRVRFGVAINQWNPDTRLEETVWVNCTAFDNMADLLEQRFTKGKRVWVSGKHSMYNGKDQLNVRSAGLAELLIPVEDNDEADEW